MIFLHVGDAVNSLVNIDPPPLSLAFLVVPILLRPRCPSWTPSICWWKSNTMCALSDILSRPSKAMPASSSDCIQKRFGLPRTVCNNVKSKHSQRMVRQEQNRKRYFSRHANSSHQITWQTTTDRTMSDALQWSMTTANSAGIVFNKS